MTGPESSSVQARELSAARRIRLLREENIELRIRLGEIHGRLHSRTSHQSEAQGRQSELQIHHNILPGDLDALQRTNLQSVTSGIFELSKYDCEIFKLLEDTRTAEGLVASQTQLIHMYEARERQQQQQQRPTCHHAEGGPLLSQYNDHNHSTQYPTYQPPRNREFNIDPNGIHQIHDLDYSIGSPIDPCDTDVVMFTAVPAFESPSPIPTFQSTPYPSPKLDVPGLNHTRGDGNKRGLEDEGANPNKKQKMK
ncbi:hypothetical protein B7494_g2772 [Chlorociboria aeruginascens]|nr:hypothetical protein B7494_g2772 [Chlorociboria aeruginascens]